MARTEAPWTAKQWLEARKKAGPGLYEQTKLIQKFQRMSWDEQQNALQELRKDDDKGRFVGLTKLQVASERHAQVLPGTSAPIVPTMSRLERFIREGAAVRTSAGTAAILANTGDLSRAEGWAIMSGAMSLGRGPARALGFTPRIGYTVPSAALSKPAPPAWNPTPAPPGTKLGFNNAGMAVPVASSKPLPLALNPALSTPEKLVPAAQGAGKLFPNQSKQFLADELADAEALGVKPRSGIGAIEELAGQRIKWAITEDGALVMIPHSAKIPHFPALPIELSHAILAPGRSVRAAGEALIKRTESGLVGEFISSYSGHFFRDKPGEGASVLHLGEAAFAALGIKFAKKMPI